jgi:flagellar basal-body rod protein FlgB
MGKYRKNLSNLECGVTKMGVQAIVYDESAQITNKMLELSMGRQKVIANNLANANTPGYVRHEFDFEKELADLVKSGDIRDLRGLQGKVVKDLEAGPARLDGNNISVSDELNQMMQNNVLYGLLSRAYSTKMGILRAAIGGGGGG